MAISGQQTILIGLPNESTGSDSLFTAFNKINDNFNTIFANASPITGISAGAGINVANSSNAITITNTGVTSLTAGSGITLSGSNGDITITASGGNGGGNISYIGLISGSANRLEISGSPLLADGNMFIDMAIVANVSGTYTNPNITVDSYGRVVAASNNTSFGTVTSVGLSPGAGIQIAGGPITSNGNITVTNTGVTRINAGPGITISSANGNVTISSPVTGGTVTSVGVNSTTLTVTGSPVVSSGTITVEIPANVNVTGRFRLSGQEDLANGAAANLLLTATYFETGATGETGTLAAGVTGQIKTFMMSADGGGDMVITVTNAAWGGDSTMTFGDVGDGCTLQYINNKWFCVGNNGVVFA